MLKLEPTVEPALRSSAFDHGILSAEGHSWHPLNKDDIDFDQAFDTEDAPLIREDLAVGVASSYVAETLAASGDRVRFVNETARRYFSQILHGERAALRFAAAMCLESADLGVQESAANQAREEARHATAFDLYIQARWGAPAPIGPVFEGFIDELLDAKEAWKRVIGMQIIIEGMAMGIFTVLGEGSLDPVAQRLIRLVSIDESFHLKAGKTCVHGLLDDADDAEREEMAEWTARKFRLLSRGLFSPLKQAEFYAEFGLDARRVARDLASQQTAVNDNPARAIFRTVARIIDNAGLVTPSHAAAYAGFLN